MKNLLPAAGFAALFLVGIFALGATYDIPALGGNARPSARAAAPTPRYAPASPSAPQPVPPNVYAPAPATGFAPAAPAFAPAPPPTFAPAPPPTFAPAPPTTQPDPGWGSPPAPRVDPRRFTEAHWQGLEVVPNTPALARALNIDPSVRGVIVDDVTLPADLQGFVAGDVVTSVNGISTPDLMSFIRASESARSASSATLGIVRGGQAGVLPLAALLERMGNANGETPSMIPPNARMPHAYRGPCVGCHRIGTTGTLMVDQGDPMPNAATVPVIRAGATRPHVDRGPCAACHTIVP